MSKKIVLKVDITAERCKAGAMSVVAKLPGIKSMAVDGEKGRDADRGGGRGRGVPCERAAEGQVHGGCRQRRA